MWLELTKIDGVKRTINTSLVGIIRPMDPGTRLWFTGGSPNHDYLDVAESYEEVRRMMFPQPPVVPVAANIEPVTRRIK